MSEYRKDASTKLHFEAELRAVPSPREEAGAVWRASWVSISLWWLICGARYYLYSRHRVTTSAEASESMLAVMMALVPVLFTPALPMRRVARLLIARRRRDSVKIAFDGTGVTWTGRTGSRDPIERIDCCMIVRTGSSLCVVVATEGTDAPLSFKVPDDRAAHRLVRSLGAGKTKVGTIVFPVWTGEEVLSILTGKAARPGRSAKRASFALLCGGFSCAMVITRLISEWLQMGVFIFLGLPAFFGGLYLFGVSWSALLDEQPAGKLTIDASKICLDGALLCFLTDHITLRIVDGPVLEIEASRILDGKRLIKPWQVGDLHELELIKATIEAYQARASKDAPE